MSIAFILFTAYSLIAGLIYLAIMAYYKQGIDKLKEMPTTKQRRTTFISVVVCFRNEENNLPQLLNSLLAQEYPSQQFEIILYNDASTDGSMAIIKNFQAQYKSHQIIYREVPHQSGANSPKKLAINEASQMSNAKLLAVTDADCILLPNWLTLIEQTYIEKEAYLIAGPVTVIQEKGWLNELQCIELHALAAVTAGAIGHKKSIMCNGANLAFDRNTFLQLDPYKYNHFISSGDDMFLMLSMQAAYPDKIEYLTNSNALVYTKGKNNIVDYLNQRVRWASKSKSYQQYAVKLVAIFVLNFNVITFLSPTLLFSKRFMLGISIFAILISIKQLADMILLSRYAKMMQFKTNYFRMFLFQYLEALLTILVAIKSIRGSYVWKDRKQHF